MPTLIPDDFDDAAAAELAKLADNVLSDPDLRKSFYKDPVKTAQDAGVDTDRIRVMFGTLAGLSLEELTLLSKLNSIWPLQVYVVESEPKPLFVF